MPTTQSLTLSPPGKIMLVPFVLSDDVRQVWLAAHPSPTQTFRYNLTRPHDDSLEAFTVLMQRRLDEPGREEYTVLGPNGTKMGTVSYMSPKSFNEIAIWIGPSWQGTLAYPEALCILLQELFEVRGLHRVQMRMHVRNPMVGRIAERTRQKSEGHLGAPEGMLRQIFPEDDGTWSDMIVTGLLAGEWPLAKRLLLDRMLHSKNELDLTDSNAVIGQK